MELGVSQLRGAVQSVPGHSVPGHLSPVIHRVSQINPMRSMALFTMLDETRIDGLGTDAGGLTDAAKGRPEGTP
jgi:hypothetical protein